MKKAKPNQKTIVGRVVSDKMDKSVTVEWEIQKQHPLYKKSFKRHVKVKAHDEKNEASQGDVVKIIETRPISKDKRYRIIEIIEKGQRG
ncbi:MAG: 30S ribosomal protein S17 [Candidatus Omnitrophica bacterium]|nr:30S ribosomal protein S17 [Candidatus Omnitrophota bacterium]MDD5487389.1 30S ribosomal protein S17 [Candidatus Omnitrophota bacterium]